LTDVALLDLGMARDAFDGELWPNSGISVSMGSERWDEKAC